MGHVTITDLDELLVTLSKHGVRRYANGDVLIVFTKQDMVECGACGERMLSKVLGGHDCPMRKPHQPTPGAAPVVELPDDLDPMCPCGHPSSEHVSSEPRVCSHGECSEALCASKDGVPPEVAP